MGRRRRGGYIRTLTARVDHFDPATEILAPWHKNTFQRDFFLSAVEDKTFEVSFRYLGREKLTAAGEEIDVEHCRMVGDEERDVWFDMAGHVAGSAPRSPSSATSSPRASRSPTPAPSVADAPGGSGERRLPM